MPISHPEVSKGHFRDPSQASQNFNFTEQKSNWPVRRGRLLGASGDLKTPCSHCRMSRCL